MYDKTSAATDLNFDKISAAPQSFFDAWMLCGATVEGKENRISPPSVFSSMMYDKRMMVLDLATILPNFTYKFKI